MKYFLISVFFLRYLANGQVGIGTDTPNASAKLDVYATNKGFLPPRISLTSATDAITISSPATGLLVYCEGDAGLAAGYYFWNGSSWEKLSLSSEIDTKANLSGATFTGALNSDTNITIGKSDGTMPSQLILNPNYPTNEGGEIKLKGPVSPTGNPDWFIDVYSEYLRLFPSAGGGMVQISKSGSVSAQKFVGDGSELTNVSGYLHAVMTSSENCAPGYKVGSGAGSWVVQNNRSISESSSNGEFVLEQGKTYSVQANLSLRAEQVSTAVVEYSIRNADNTILGSKGRCTSGSQYSTDIAASAIITPSTSNQCRIYLKTDTETAPTAYSAGFCSITIVEIK